MRKLLYEITHSTTYQYTGDVSVSHHLLRLTPRHNHKQHCLAYDLTIAPEPGTVSVHRDYFGNSTPFSRAESPHQQLLIQAAPRSLPRLRAPSNRLPALPWFACALCERLSRDRSPSRPAKASRGRRVPRVGKFLLSQHRLARCGPHE